jgi:serine/threonine-protein kinase
MDLIGDHIGAYRVTAAVPGGYAAVHRHTAKRARILVAPTGGTRAVIELVRTIEALPHPGIARVVDRGVLADHRPWFAFEVPSGLPLFDLIARRPMPSAEVGSLVHDLADVLAFAHERGVTHRGLTARSIVMTTGTRAFPICIVDFGIAEGPNDPAADVHALGVIAYRAVTQLFPANAIDSVPGAEPALGELIVRMLARELTAAEVRGALMPALTDDQVHISARFSAPKWTPAPPITSEAAAFVAGEIVEKTEKV